MIWVTVFVFSRPSFLSSFRSLSLPPYPLFLKQKRNHMSTVQGLHTRVNLKNGDVFYGIATQVDDDGSISLENGKPEEKEKRWP